MPSPFKMLTPFKSRRTGLGKGSYVLERKKEGARRGRIVAEAVGVKKALWEVIWTDRTDGITETYSSAQLKRVQDQEVIEAIERDLRSTNATGELRTIITSMESDDGTEAVLTPVSNATGRDLSAIVATMEGDDGTEAVLTPVNNASGRELRAIVTGMEGDDGSDFELEGLPGLESAIDVEDDSDDDDDSVARANKSEVEDVLGTLAILEEADEDGENIHEGNRSAFQLGANLESEDVHRRKRRQYLEEKRRMIREKRSITKGWSKKRKVEPGDRVKEVRGHDVASRFVFGFSSDIVL